MFKKIAATAFAVLCLIAHTQNASAQDTLGAQTMQIIPVVVDTASFKSRISFLNPYTADAIYNVLYVPGDGTAQFGSGPLNCPQITITAGATLGFASLRDICPALATGSNFGYLEIVRSNNHGLNQRFDQLGIHVFSRVSNPAGQGFSVDAIPMYQIAASRQYLSGLRRLTQTANSPAYQSNCFMGTLGSANSRPVTVSLENSQGNVIGTPFDISLSARRFVRYLDIFNAAGLPSGNYDDIKVTFTSIGSQGEANSGEFFSFCTVQDNTSFGADFRIGKTAYPIDQNRRRSISLTADALGRPFQIPDGVPSYYVLFALEARYPDYIKCGMASLPNTTVSTLSTSHLWLDSSTKKLTRLEVSSDYVYFPSFEKGLVNDGNDSAFYFLAEYSGGTTGIFGLLCESGSGISAPVIIDQGIGPFIAPTLP